MKALKKIGDQILPKKIKPKSRFSTREVVVDFVKFLSKSYPKRVSLNKIIEKRYLGKSHTISSTIIFLEFFNVIKVVHRKQRRYLRVKSELASNFLLSLSVYLQEKLPLVSNWRLREDVEEYTVEHMFNRGMQFLYQMELRRVEQLFSKTTKRKAEVMILIIKANIKGLKKPRYLYRYQKASFKFSTIGGLKSDLDQKDEQTITRIIRKELAFNNLVLDQNCHAKRIAPTKESKKLSQRSGLYSDYKIHIYQLFIDQSVLKLSSLERWLSVEEMLEGCTVDGIHATVFFEYLKENAEFIKLLNKLPLSLKEVQPNQNLVLEKGNVKKTRKQVLKNKKVKVLLNQEESETLEFKSSLRWDYKTETVNKGLENIIVKSVCAFLNSEGGALLLGVNNDKEVLGIGKDLATLPRKNEDGYMQFLINLLASNIGIEFTSFLDIAFEKVNNKIVCIVDIKKSVQPVFIKAGQVRMFFIRAGNTTRQLNAEEAYHYIEMHW